MIFSIAMMTYLAIQCTTVQTPEKSCINFQFSPDFSHDTNWSPWIRPLLLIFRRKEKKEGQPGSNTPRCFIQFKCQWTLNYLSWCPITIYVAPICVCMRSVRVLALSQRDNSYVFAHKNRFFLLRLISQNYIWVQLQWQRRSGQHRTEMDSFEAKIKMLSPILFFELVNWYSHSNRTYKFKQSMHFVMRTGMAVHAGKYRLAHGTRQGIYSSTAPNKHLYGCIKIWKIWQNKHRPILWDCVNRFIDSFSMPGTWCQCILHAAASAASKSLQTERNWMCVRVKIRSSNCISLEKLKFHHISPVWNALAF